jgi:hypothetical protein
VVGLVAFAMPALVDRQDSNPFRREEWPDEVPDVAARSQAVHQDYRRAWIRTPPLLKMQTQAVNENETHCAKY